MKKLFVEDVKVGVSKGGIACGPVSGHVFAEVCIRDQENETVMYHSLVEVEGTLVFYRTEESIYDIQIEENYDDEESWEMVNDNSVGDYGDYSEFFEDLTAHETIDEDLEPIWRFLVYLVRADWDEIEEMEKKSMGKCLGDFEIPMTDVEQEYLEDNCEEESEDFEESEESETQESFLDKINDDFRDQKIDMDAFLDRDENESPEGYYSSHQDFQVGENHYRLEYSLWVNDNAEITSVEWPKCLKLVGDEYVPCPYGEVSNRKIYEELYDELNCWL